MLGRPQWVVLLLLLVAALVWWRLPTGEQQFSRTALVMGTLVEIKALGADQKQLEIAVNDAFAEMSRLERLLSRHLPQSEVSHLSAAATALNVSTETAELLTLGQQIARQSDGAFDLTLGGVKRLWAIESDTPQIPTAGQLQVALEGVGPESLQINGLRVRKSIPALEVDLGGIAKGYAVDRAVEVLRLGGITSAAVNAGGDIVLLGDRQGQPWRIGIQHPRQKDELLTTLPVVNRAVVTSGDYERFFEQGGRRYHHIFDPRSGQPARLSQSVTVVAKDAASADALATAAFVLGPQAGLAFLERLADVEGLIVGIDGTLHRTSGLQGSE